MERSVDGFDRAVHDSPGLFVRGIRIGRKATAYSIDLLRETPVIEDVIGDTPILVVHDLPSTPRIIFSRRVGERTLSFDVLPDGGILRDRDTGSSWDRYRGIATAGMHEGKRLDFLPSIVSCRRAWKHFHPAGRIRNRLPRRPQSARRVLEKFSGDFEPVEHSMRPPDDTGWRMRLRALRDPLVMGTGATVELLKAPRAREGARLVLAAQALSPGEHPAAHEDLQEALVEDDSGAVRVQAVDVLGLVADTDSRALLHRR